MAGKSKSDSTAKGARIGALVAKSGGKRGAGKGCRQPHDLRGRQWSRQLDRRAALRRRQGEHAAEARRPCARRMQLHRRRHRFLPRRPDRADRHERFDGRCRRPGERRRRRGRRGGAHAVRRRSPDRIFRRRGCLARHQIHCRLSRLSQGAAESRSALLDRQSGGPVGARGGGQCDRGTCPTHYDWRPDACRAIFYISDEELDSIARRRATPRTRRWRSARRSRPPTATASPSSRTT